MSAAFGRLVAIDVSPAVDAVALVLPGSPQTIARLWQLRSYSCAATPVPTRPRSARVEAITSPSAIIL